MATWCFDMLKTGIHEARATQTPGPPICEGIHLSICTHAVCAYMPPACTQTHTCPSPACSPPTLFLSHYLTPIKYDRITQESHHQPVYSDSCFCRGSTFLVRSYSISLLSGFHTSAPLSSRFLIFFSSFFLFLRGCFTKLNTVCFGRSQHCKRACLVGGRWVRCVCQCVGSL